MVWLKIRGWIDHHWRLPELRGLSETDFDTPDVARLQRRIFQSKPALRHLYREYCRPCVESAGRASPSAVMVELGAGTTPLREHLPGVIATDLLPLPWLQLACSAYRLPFADHSLDRLFLLFVTHHLGRMEALLDEADRCLKPGGEMVIVDPAITWFSRFYYRYLHVDHLDLDAPGWTFAGEGRLSDSNIALPWIVFFRDRATFQQRYPDLVIAQVSYNTCLAFLLSGGLRLRPLLPTLLLVGLSRLENWLIRHVTHQLAVTMMLVIRKR